MRARHGNHMVQSLHFPSRIRWLTSHLPAVLYPLTRGFSLCAKQHILLLPKIGGIGEDDHGVVCVSLKRRGWYLTRQKCVAIVQFSLNCTWTINGILQAWSRQKSLQLGIVGVFFEARVIRKFSTVRCAMYGKVCWTHWLTHYSSCIQPPKFC